MPYYSCSKSKMLVVIAGCVLWLAALGWIDRATGYELGLFAFYTAPVAVVAWYLGRNAGIVVAVMASIIWYLADRYAGDHYSRPFFGYWNTAMHLSTFLINAFTFSKIRSALVRHRELERALAESREHIRKLRQLIDLVPMGNWSAQECDKDSSCIDGLVAAHLPQKGMVLK